jgi:hypothetical protein
MSIFNKQNVKILAYPRPLFDGGFVSEEITLDNAQTAEIHIEVGAGAQDVTSIRVIALNGTEEKIIEEQQVELGIDREIVFYIDADRLAHDNFDRIKIVIDSVTDCEITGCIFAVLNNEKFSNE